MAIPRKIFHSDLISFHYHCISRVVVETEKIGLKNFTWNSHGGGVGQGVWKARGSRNEAADWWQTNSDDYNEKMTLIAPPG